jgi:hypothetical protein
MWAGGPALPSPGDPQAEPTIGKAINGGFDLLEAKCNRCDRISLVPLRALKHPPDTPVWNLEAALYCEPCSTRRRYSERQRARILGLILARIQKPGAWPAGKGETVAPDPYVRDKFTRSAFWWFESYQAASASV